MISQISSSQNSLNRPQPAPPKLQKKAQKKDSDNPKNQGAKSNKEQPKKPKKKTKGKFHNPYNFIPSPQRELKGDLGDFEPRGHKEYLEDYWSGKITCTLTTKTPLLIPDAANLTEENISNKSDSEKDDNKHNTYPIRIVNGKPYLAPTSIKGMLRNAYEAVTNSRFGVFEEHSDRLAYRMGASSMGVIPARVERSGDGLVLQLMKGGIPSNTRENPGKTNPYAANLPCYTPKITKTYPNGATPQHGDAVWVVLKPNSNSKKVGNQEVDEIELRNNETRPGSNQEWKRGWVCITGRNIKNKKYERVFVEGGDQELPVDDKVQQKWKELIENYQKAHEKDLEWRKEKNIKPDEYKGDEPGKTAWSRHIYTKNAEELTEGTLCYVILNKNGDKIQAILPVIISRRLYNTAPESLLINSSLHPPEQLAELSPSDRLFGWVNQQGTGAYRGQLRISNVECQSADAVLKFNDGGLALGILGEPKPEQVRFYLANKNGEPFENSKNKNQGYQNGQNLRGRKVYPHQKNVDWENPTEDKPQNKEYRRPESVKDSQNRSIKDWVKPETTFEFTLDVINLSSVELGALLWLLDFKKYQNEDNQELHHRLGGGKPFGFGSVQIKITETDLRLGKSWREFYGSLLPVELPKQDFSECVENFKNAVQNAYSQSNFKEVEFIAAFLKSARGFDDNLPVHYPRLDREAKSENKNYEWFVENEKKNGQKLPLPALTKDDGLPYTPTKK